MGEMELQTVKTPINLLCYSLISNVATVPKVNDNTNVTTPGISKIQVMSPAG